MAPPRRARVESLTDLPVAQRPEDRAGQPGTRAPHLWLTNGNERRSTLDLFHRDWTLLSEDPAWAPAARQQPVPIEFVCVGTAIEPGTFATAYGLGPGGAALVRPDGYIAWRAVTAPDNRTRALAAAIDTAALPETRR